MLGIHLLLNIILACKIKSVKLFVASVILFFVFYMLLLGYYAIIGTPLSGLLFFFKTKYSKFSKIISKNVILIPLLIIGFIVGVMYPKFFLNPRIENFKSLESSYIVVTDYMLNNINYDDINLAISEDYSYLYSFQIGSDNDKYYLPNDIKKNLKQMSENTFNNNGHYNIRYNYISIHNNSLYFLPVGKLMSCYTQIHL